jgi:hypothetical protein
MKGHFKIAHSIWVHPANRHNRLGAIFRSVVWWLGPLRKSKEICIPAFGYKLFLCPDAVFSRSYVYYTAFKDYDMMTFIQRYLRPGDIFIDAGANIGVYTLLARSIVGQDGHIHAFEPVPETLARLKKNIRDNNLENVTIYPLALGESTENLKFTCTEDATNHAVSDDENLIIRENNQVFTIVER